MKDRAKIVSLTIILSLVAFIMTSVVCDAQEWNRKGKGEIFVLGQQMTGDTVTGLGMEVKVDDTIVGGFGAGFNFHDYLNVNMDIFFGSTDLTARGLGATVKTDTDLFGMDFNLDYNILKSRFTPMISGGFGFIDFRGHINRYYVKFAETDFSYNLGVGFRWDVTDHFLIKGIYRFTWTELEDSDGSIRLDGVSVSIGYLF
jgi:opacity protein-like surface antigen